jgi:hypothetical protein
MWDTGFGERWDVLIGALCGREDAFLGGEEHKSGAFMAPNLWELAVCCAYGLV